VLAALAVPKRLPRGVGGLALVGSVLGTCFFSGLASHAKLRPVAVVPVLVIFTLAVYAWTRSRRRFWHVEPGRVWAYMLAGPVFGAVAGSATASYWPPVASVMLCAGAVAAAMWPLHPRFAARLVQWIVATPVLLWAAVLGMTGTAALVDGDYWTGIDWFTRNRWGPLGAPEAIAWSAGLAAIAVGLAVWIGRAAKRADRRG
jgi:hypothetical protein